MILAFHLHRPPRSANKGPRPEYTRAIAEAARQHYAGDLVTGPLYSRIIWFHKYESLQGDADNIAKRIHDALKGVLFADDRIVTHTMSIRVDASQPVDIVSGPDLDSAGRSLAISLADETVRDILYIELGRQVDRRIHLGPIQ